MTTALYIDGRFVETTERLPVINPATEEIFAEVSVAGDQHVDAAVTAARRAFEGAWQASAGAQRARYLRLIAQGIRAQRDSLAHTEVLDNGKPLPEAVLDIDDAAGCFDYYADLAEELDHGAETPIDLPDARFRTLVRREPIGVAGQIIPWNYPLLMAAWKVAPALAAGATVVLKPSELTPLTALALGKIAADADLPPGVLNILSGAGSVGAAIARHPGVAKLAFTGSVPTGVKIMQAAAADIKAVSLELGGKSPFIIFDDADIAQAVEWILFGIFWNQGQVCSATSRLLVQEKIAPRLLERLAEETRRITIGDGLDPGVLLGPLVSAGQLAKVSAFIDTARKSGIPLLTGGGRPAQLQRGYFLQPTVFVDVPVDAPLWREEIFGPVLAVRTFREESEALRLANDSEFGLGAAVMSADVARADRVARQLRAGIVWINCSQPTFTQAPWGGYKKSGIGRELGRWGLENYLETKQITRFDTTNTWGWYLKP